MAPGATSRLRANRARVSRITVQNGRQPHLTNRQLWLLGVWIALVWVFWLRQFLPYIDVLLRFLRMEGW